MSLKAVGDTVQTGQIIQMPLKNSFTFKALDRRQKSNGAMVFILAAKQNNRFYQLVKNAFCYGC